MVKLKLKPGSTGEEYTTRQQQWAYMNSYTLFGICVNPRVLSGDRGFSGGGRERERLRIVKEAREQDVAMLVLSQKKGSSTWILLTKWAGNGVTGGVVEYCIQNATCMAIAVRRKSKNLEGYLITSKRHKDFWLLAL